MADQAAVKPEATGSAHAAPARVTDIHIHIQPWRQLKPAARDTMRRGKEEHFDFLLSLMDDPHLLLRILDEQQIARVGLVNYPSPNIMGFTAETNEFAARYAETDRARLLPYGGVDPLTTSDVTGAVDHLVELGIRVLKIHPPHQGFAANAYTHGLDALATIYRKCESHGLPVMVHTGTSIFPGARSKYGNPMELDDVAIDFPDLQIIMAHGGRPLYMAEAFFILRRHRQVWLDLSGIPPRRLLEYFPRIEELAPKLLWGTDWPSPGVSSMRENVEQFLALPIAEAVKRAALEENPERLLPT
ncbi:MAG TPA: amidohydrolase family protein [Gemmatimonadaceae bacterium]|nr:amidohydrolase family protein [Gemmatimonadaceae bacterium]